MYGEVGVKILQELKRSKWLPPYNVRNCRGRANRVSNAASDMQEDAMRRIVREQEELWKLVSDTWE
jgi:hypothetical protein